MLTWSWATAADAEEFENFACCGERREPWVLEAETYVRYWVLRQAQYVLTHRDEHGSLVAVSAFDEAVIGLPLQSPTDHAGWHIQVVAVGVEYQNQGHSAQVFASTFDAMRQLDPERVFVTANVHQDHVISNRTCARAGLTRWIPLDAVYWTLLGDVPELL